MNDRISESEAIFNYKIHTGRVLLNEKLTSNIVRIRIENLELARASRPGQFVNVKTSDNFLPLLRRPFSIHRTEQNSGWFELLYQVIGPGTELLAKFKKDESINLLGPLGNTFSIPEHCDHAVLIAGGLGIAPLIFLGQTLSSRNIPATLFWGNRSKKNICCLPELNMLGIRTFLSTDDGSHEFKGFVTELVSTKAAEIQQGKPQIFACGPNVMLNKVKDIAADMGIPCQFSLETMMACGFGVCLGCNVNSANPQKTYQYVCKDGPVFNSDEINLSE